jgi:uncharacterized repeat protein (TIGR03803 family)
MAEELIVVVTGSTGKQGGAVRRWLWMRHGLSNHSERQADDAAQLLPSNRLRGWRRTCCGSGPGHRRDFYGTTLGFPIDAGTVFKITPGGTLTTLHAFDGNDPANGLYPEAPLVQAANGDFYGTTEQGGVGNANGRYGTIFKITASGNLTTLYSFCTGSTCTDGAKPYAGLVQGTDGNLYGTTEGGGANGYGTVFEINPKTRKLTTLYNFCSKSGCTDGAKPYAGLVQDTNGTFYGTTEQGGTSTACEGGCGTVFSLSVGLAPFVTFLPPQSSGKVGKTIEFFGQGFKSSTTVTFYGGIAATPSVKSGTYLTAAVPNGALTGVVTVTTSGVTLKSNKIFRVIPQITSFKPTSGPVGTVVTIKGIGLKQTTKVTFGGMKATTVTIVNDTRVKATVPSGAVTGKVAITTPGGTAVSSGVFTVT